jgi:hypothetical protein
MMEQMRLELKKSGVDVYFVAINQSDAIDYQQELIARCSFPLFQDLDSVDAKELHYGGQKDDIYVYDKNGRLFDYLPISGTRTTILATPEGYKVLKDVVLAAAKK